MEQQKIYKDIEKIKIPLQNGSLEKITMAYRDAIGIDPTKKNLTREEMLSGIENPLMERERIRMIEEGFDEHPQYGTGLNQ